MDSDMTTRKDVKRYYFVVFKDFRLSESYRVQGNGAENDNEKLVTVVCRVSVSIFSQLISAAYIFKILLAAKYFITVSLDNYREREFSNSSLEKCSRN